MNIHQKILATVVMVAIWLTVVYQIVAYWYDAAFHMSASVIFVAAFHFAFTYYLSFLCVKVFKVKVIKKETKK